MHPGCKYVAAQHALALAISQRTMRLRTIRTQDYCVRLGRKSEIWRHARKLRETAVKRNFLAEKPPWTQESCAAAPGGGRIDPPPISSIFLIVSSIFLIVSSIFLIVSSIFLISSK